MFQTKHILRWPQTTSWFAVMFPRLPTSLLLKWVAKQKKTKVNKDHPKPERKIGAWMIVWLSAFPVIFCPSLTCEGTKVLEVCRPTLAPSCDASQSVDAWIDMHVQIYKIYIYIYTYIYIYIYAFSYTIHDQHVSIRFLGPKSCILT